MKFDKWIIQTGPRVIARKLNVDPSTVSNWQKGKAFPRPEKLQEINVLSRGRISYKTMIHHYLEAQK